VSSDAGGTLAHGLYVVATPIGNLGDLSPRAARVLRESQIVAAEDTRTSGVLLRAAGSSAKLLSLTEHNVAARAPQLLAEARNAPVALVSDAGTPAVSDPGARLVAAAHAAGVPVRAVPGPSALTAALSVAGFDLVSVTFLGFLPRTSAARRKALRQAAGASALLVFFESPRRLAAALDDVASELKDPEVAVCRELSKLYEEVVRGRASELARRFGDARGECTVVVQVPPAADADPDDVSRYMAEMRRAGARRSAAAAEAARRFGLARKRAYALWDESADGS